MLKSISIKNFKSLKNLQISSLSRITLLGGKNNVGKSTLLEAIFLFLDRLNPNMTIRQFNWRGISEIPLNSDAIFAPIFNDFDTNNTIQISVSYEQNLKETMTIQFKKENRTVILPTQIQPNNMNGQIKTNQESIASSILEIKYDKTNFPIQNINLVVNNQGIGMEIVNAKSIDIQAAFLSARSHIDPSENAIRFSNLDIQGKAEKLVKQLNIIEPRLRSLSVAASNNGKSMIYGDLGMSRKFPISYMGDGFNRIVAILLVIASTENGIVFIDEIENGIHYSVLPDIWKVILQSSKDFNCQVIATTHSYECLQSAVEGITEDLKDEFEYIRLEKNNDSEKIVPKYFSYDILKSAVQRGWEVR